MDLTKCVLPFLDILEMNVMRTPSYQFTLSTKYEYSVKEINHSFTTLMISHDFYYRKRNMRVLS